MIGAFEHEPAPIVAYFPESHAVSVLLDSNFRGAASSGGGRVFADLGGGAGDAGVAANFFALGAGHRHSTCRAAVAGWAGCAGRGASKGIGARATTTLVVAGTFVAYRDEI
jgi:hypothetical protein